MSSAEEQVLKAQELLGYSFADRELLLAAITHPSATEGLSFEHSYERLEFLGDSVLGAIVARAAYDAFPHLDEGGLTRVKVALVSGSSLARLAEELGLGTVIIFGSSETGTGKRGLHSALENVYEAVVGAISLDGGFVAARDFVERTLLPSMDISLANEPENPKSTLQELFQEHRITPTYEIIETLGPPHDRFFVARAMADGVALSRGEGHSKKEAEVAAAKAALEVFPECLAKVRRAKHSSSSRPNEGDVAEEAGTRVISETDEETGEVDLCI